MPSSTPPIEDSVDQRATFDDFMTHYPTAAGYELVRAGTDERQDAQIS